MRVITWYRQSSSDKYDRGGEPIELEDALRMLAALPSPGDYSSSGEILGFQSSDGGFIEFEKIGDDEYSVRYDDPVNEARAVGVLTYEKAREVLTDFFEGRVPRWIDELEPY